MTTAHPVTVIVPVYGDLPTLVSCVESLLANIDRSAHRVLLVNDCGPQAEEIERALLDLIEGQDGFAYARNPANLGFVGTCNRAVFELDRTDNDILLLNSDTVTTSGFLEELSAVLHLSPRHGAVCPRSNNATIASLPFLLRDPTAARSVERTAEVHEALSQDLPRFSIAPVAMGFCLLIRRDLIREYGLFDEAFAPGYGEENDFCLRVRKHGFVSVIAHRPLVFHVGGRSFGGGRREVLRAAHERLIVRRYPFYAEAVQAYIHVERDPVDVFADALVADAFPRRALIDIGNDPSPWDLALLEAAQQPIDDLVVDVSVADKGAAGMARSFPRLRVIPHSRLSGLWDVALVCSPAPSHRQLARLNRVSPRWVQPQGDTTEFADVTIDLPQLTAAQALLALGTEWADSPVDSGKLRKRWREFTSEPGYLRDARRAGAPRLSRLLRRMRVVFPRTFGRLSGLLKARRDRH